MKEYPIIFMSLLIFILLVTESTRSQWSGNPELGTPICTDYADQLYSEMVSDGQGGAIIAWFDKRNVLDRFDIYAQRVNAEGYALWELNGIPVCTSSSAKMEMKMVSDGTGGAIVTWSNSLNNNTDIYAQRINGDGIIQWSAEGVPVISYQNLQHVPEIVTDGAGGAIICWTDFRNSKNDIYAQRIDSNGNLLWSASGVEIRDTINNGGFGSMIADNNGGAFIAWSDERDFNSTWTDIYIQRIGSSGGTFWDDNGKPVIIEQDAQDNPIMVLDSQGHIVVIWRDSRSGATPDIYAQKIDPDGGGKYWNTSGVQITSTSDIDITVQIISDESGGTLITFLDKSPSDRDLVISQRLGSDGQTSWNGNGIVVCNSLQPKSPPKVISESNNGAIIIWGDYRSGNEDIYAQKILYTGNLAWQENGIEISKIDFNQTHYNLISDGDNGAIVSWDDPRYTNDIYAERLLGDGTLTSIEEEGLIVNNFLLKQNYPNPFNPNTKIKYSVPHSSKIVIKVYDILGNEVATLLNEEKPYGSYDVEFDASGLSSGIYFYKLKAGEFIQTKKMILMK